jgi:arylsulfatase
MTFDLGVPGYQGYLNNACVTIPEVLHNAGYRTYMSGKWHVGGNYQALNPESWKTCAGDESHPTPTQRGFDRFYGILNGLGSFFDPVTLMDQDHFVRADRPDYYITDAITDKALEMLKENQLSHADKPFFLYLAYTAAHWPLHAWEKDIAKYEGVYKKGWDCTRTARHEQAKGMGLLDSRWSITPRDEDAPEWKAIQNKDWEAYRMAVYAAQIDRMDQNIGRIVSYLKEKNLEDNTLIFFLSDNGGCAEFLLEEPGKPDPSIWGDRTRDGKPIRIGNIAEILPGPEETFMTYDLPWTNVSNCPFRLYKHWIHEGGISTPCIAYWPDEIKQPSITHTAAQLVDITATIIDAAGAEYPSQRKGVELPPAEGESFLGLLKGKKWEKQRPMLWEHEGNRAIRIGEWKLVSESGKPWELYNMTNDRTELNNLIEKTPNRAVDLEKLYNAWAERCGVLPWPVKQGETVLKMKGRHIHLSYHRGRKFYP